MTLLNQVNKVLLATTNSPIETIHFFLNLLIEGIENVASFKPQHKEAKILPMKDNVVKHRNEDAELFIDRYNNLISEMSLHWANLAKKWNTPKSIDTSKLLEKEISSFKTKLTQSFENMKLTALKHRYNITFVLDNYSDLSKTQINLLEKSRKLLTEISKMNYITFIKELKKGILPTLNR